MFVGASSGFPVGSDGVTGEPPSETSWAAVLPLFFLFFCVCASQEDIYITSRFFFTMIPTCVLHLRPARTRQKPPSFLLEEKRAHACSIYCATSWASSPSSLFIHSFIIINPVSPGVVRKRPELTIVVFFHLQDGRRSEEKGTTRKFFFILFAAVRWWSFCCTALQTKESHRHKLSLADYGSSRSLERKSNSTWWRRRGEKKLSRRIM